MAIAHLSTEDQAAVGAAYVAYLNANHTFSVEDAAWPAVLGQELFERALEGGYFPPDAYPGLDRDTSRIRGAEVQVLEREVDDGGNVARLYVDGFLTAEEAISGNPGNFDTVEFAKRHGQDI